jgi:alpha-beta hydrolase superfamily lysophospholipase
MWLAICWILTPECTINSCLRRLLPTLLLCASMSSYGASLIRHTVKVDRHPIALWEKTPDNPKAQILLLHGRTWSSLPDFDLQVNGEDLSFMDGLNERGYSVFALDARGYGETPRDDTGWLTPNKSATDATTILNWIKKRSTLPLHLYGWSYGSMVSQLVVQENPDIVSTVIFFGYPFDPARHVVARDTVYPDQPVRAANTAKNAASDFITPGSISEKAIDAYVKVALTADPFRVDFRDLHEWGALDASKIVTPALLLQGEFDPLAPTEAQAAFYTSIATADKWWVVLPGGDHAALLETTRQKMLQAIDSFIESAKK